MSTQPTPTPEQQAHNFALVNTIKGAAYDTTITEIESRFGLNHNAAVTTLANAQLLWMKTSEPQKAIARAELAAKESAPKANGHSTAEEEKLATETVLVEEKTETAGEDELRQTIINMLGNDSSEAGQRAAAKKAMQKGLVPDEARQLVADVLTAIGTTETTTTEQAATTEQPETVATQAEAETATATATATADAIVRTDGPKDEAQAELQARYAEYSSYLRAIFKPNDVVCLVTIEHNADGDRKKEKVYNTFATLEDAMGYESFLKLVNANNTPSSIAGNTMPSIYIATNTYPTELIGKMVGRTQANVVEVRALQADADHDGSVVVNKMDANTAVPAAPILVESSVGKFQGIWPVDGISKEDAKPIMQAMAASFGTDSSVAEIARVMRVPGFYNRKPKYNPSPLARTVRNEVVRYTRTDFKLDATAATKPESDKAAFDLEQPFIHGKLDNQIVAFIGHYMAADNIKNPDILSKLIAGHIEDNGCYEPDANDESLPDLNTSFSCDMDRVKELCELKVKDWKTGEEKRKANELQFTQQPDPAIVAAQAAAQDAAGDDEETLEDKKEEPFPDFPVFTGVLTDLAGELFPSLPLEFKQWGLISRWGLMRSGVDTFGFEKHIQPRFYSIFVCLPNRGKTACINETRTIMEGVMATVKSECDNSDKVMVCANVENIPSVDSGQFLASEFYKASLKMSDRCSDKTAKIMMDPDEMSDVFEKGRVLNGRQSTLFIELLKLYSANRTGSGTKTEGKVVVTNAHLAILGGTTVQKYPMLWMGTGGGADGLVSRFIPITTNNPQLPPIPLQTTDKAPALVERLHSLAQLPAQNVTLSDEAGKMLNDWWASFDNTKESAARVIEAIKQLLIVLAVVNTPPNHSGNTVTVGTDLMAQAIAFGEYVIAARERLNPNDSWTVVQAMENAITDWLRKNATRKEPKSRNDCRRGIHPQRRPGGLSTFNWAWDACVKAGVVKLRRQEGKAVLYSL